MKTLELELTFPNDKVVKKEIKIDDGYAGNIEGPMRRDKVFYRNS